MQCTVFGCWLASVACNMVGKWELGHGSLIAGNFFLSFLYLFWLLVIYKFVIAREILEKSMFYALLHLNFVCDTHLLQVLCEYLNMHLITMSAYAFFCSLTMAGISVKHVESFQENCWGRSFHLYYWYASHKEYNS